MARIPYAETRQGCHNPSAYAASTGYLTAIFRLDEACSLLHSTQYPHPLPVHVGLRATSSKPVDNCVKREECGIVGHDNGLAITCWR